MGFPDVFAHLRRGLPALALLAACTTPTTDFALYETTVVRFKSATDVTAKAVSKHIVAIRDVDQQRLLGQLEDAKNPCELLWVSARAPAGAEPSDCAFTAIEVIRKGRFSADAIEARVQVFDALNDYTDLLSALATSDAPADWDRAARGLGASVAGLAETIEGVGNRETLGKVGELAGRDGPLTRLVSLMGEDWINRKRSDALDATVLRVRPHIEAISRLMREDFAFVRSRDTFIEEERLGERVFEYALAVAAFQEDESKKSERDAAFRSVRDAIRLNETRIGEIRTIGTVLDAFDDSHGALVAYARSDKDPDDLTAFIVAVDRYAKVADDLLAQLDDEE